MTVNQKDYSRYKGILFTQEDVIKITNSASLHRDNLVCAFEFIKKLHQDKKLSIDEISDFFNTNKFFIEKVVRQVKREENFNKDALEHEVQIKEHLEEKILQKSLEKVIGKATLYKIFKYYDLSPNRIKTLLHDFLSHWLGLRNIGHMATELEISRTYVSALVAFIKNNYGGTKELNKYLDEIKKAKVSEKKKKRILKTNELYKRLGTLEAVGKELNITRERVRQILEVGHIQGIIVYKPSPIRRFDEAAKQITKDDLEECFKKLGSKKRVFKHLNDKYELSSKIFEALIKLYNIDLEYLLYLSKKNRCLSEYQEMVQELGFHPTTTIMSDRPKWRALWSRITKMWGNMDDFRREFGIPIPKKGSPTFKEDMLEGRAERIKEFRMIKSEKIQRIIEFVNKNSPASRKQIQIALNLKSATLEKYIKEIVDEDKIDWMWDGKKYLYFGKK